MVWIFQLFSQINRKYNSFTYQTRSTCCRVSPVISEGDAAHATWRSANLYWGSSCRNCATWSASRDCTASETSSWLLRLPGWCLLHLFLVVTLPVGCSLLSSAYNTSLLLLWLLRLIATAQLDARSTTWLMMHLDRSNSLSVSTLLHFSNIDYNYKY